MAQKNFADAMNQIVNGTNGLKSQINTKADKHSPNFTGTPTAVTADNETDSTQLATTEFCQNLIRRLVGSAPETLNTLVELATAINNDPTFAQTIVQALDGKLNKTDAANTYATKAELSNVSVDTTNLAKLNAANIFTSESNQFKNNILLQGRSRNANIVAYKDTDGFAIRFGDKFKIEIDDRSFTIGNTSSPRNYIYFDDVGNIQLIADGKAMVGSTQIAVD